MKVMTYKNDSAQVKTLVQKDPKLISLFERKKEIIVQIDDDYFVSLVHTIVAQQLSSKVAAIISDRLKELFKNNITPEKILNTSFDTFRAIGLSKQKIEYLNSLATHYVEKKIDFSHVAQLSDQEVIEMLIQIKGIGVWSAQMFLIFSLGREDVFSYHDLGLRNAVKKLYEDPDLTQQDIENITHHWQPYRSIVAHYLWHAWDNP